MANGTDNPLQGIGSNSLGENDRRPDLESVQDETSRVDTPDPTDLQGSNDTQSEQEEGEISYEEAVLNAANEGDLDIGEEDQEELSYEQAVNRSRVRDAARVIPRLVAEKEQEWLQQMKEGDELSYGRSVSAANNAVKGLLEFAPGAVETTAIIGAGFYNLFQDEENDINAEDTDWYKAGSEMGEALEEAFPTSDFYRDEFLAGTLAKGSGQMIGNVLAAWATGGNSMVASFAASATYNATLSSQYYEEAKAEGATEEEAVSNTLVNMAGVSAMEALPMARMIRRANKATGNGIGKALKSGFKGSVEEAIQEGSQTMFENASGQAIYDSSRELTDGIYHAMGAGAILGGAANTTMTGLMDQRNFAETWEDRLAAETASLKLAENYGDLMPSLEGLNQQERVDKMKEFFEAIHIDDGGLEITEDTGTEMGVLSPEVRPINYVKETKKRELWTKYIRTGGLEGKGIMVAREKRDALIDEQLEKMQINLHGLNRSILQEYDSNEKKDFRKAANNPDDNVPSDIGLKVDQALRGEETNLPDGVKEQVEAMRIQVLQLSNSFIKRGFVEGKMKATFMKNFGTYVHRDYKLFNDDVTWNKETIPDDVWNRGVAYLRGRIRRKLKEQEGQQQSRNEKLKAMIQNDVPLGSRELPQITEPESMTEEEINRRADQQLEEILLSDSQNSLKKMFQDNEVSVDRGDRDLLLQRDEIPQPIRDVMGEYRDGAVNYINTVNKMANHLEKRQFFDDIADRFKGTLFFSKKDLRENGEDLTQYRTGLDDGGLGSKLGKSGENALYMHKDLYEAMTESANPDHDHGMFMTTWLRGNSMAKYSKTVLSHVAHFRNVMGGTAFLAFNGHMFKGLGGESAWRKASIVFKSYDKLNDQQLEEAWQDYVKLGLSGGSVKAGEMRDVMSDVLNNPDVDIGQWMSQNFNHGNAASGPYKSSKSWFKKWSRKATNLYQAEDAFLRIWMFELEKARLQEADPSITDQQVADIVNDTYPNYNRVNNAIKGLRKWPIAPFISFPAEVIRTSFNSARLALEEMRSDNPARQKIGRKRISGMFTTFSASIAVGAASQAMVGMTDEEEQSIRQFLPPWSRNSTLAYISSSQGKVRYMNTSYTNPYEFMMDPVFALFQGDSDRNVERRMKDSMKELFEPIMSEEIFTKAFLDVLRNTSDGSEIWNPEDNMGDKAQKAFLHMWESVEPGSLSSLDRFSEPIIEEESSRNVSDELMGLLGTRVSTVDVERSFGFRVRDFRERIRNSRRKYNSVKFDEGATNREKREAFEESNQSYEEIFTEMYQMAQAAQTTGIDWYTLEEIMEDSGLASRDISAIRTGSFTPFER